MAVPPTIPTSFVPKQPITSAPKRRTSAANPFLALSYVILIVAVLGAAATFGYEFFLKSVETKKAAQVEVAQNSIDQGTLSGFVRLRDRFSSAKDILNRQVALSQFLDVLGSLTLQSVQYSNLSVKVNADRTAEVTLVGIARTFNSLAAQSQTIGTDKRIKQAIFSGIAVDEKTHAVGFTLTATIDPALIVRPANGQPAVQPSIASSTPTASSTPLNKVSAPAGTTTKP